MNVMESLRMIYVYEHDLLIDHMAGGDEQDGYYYYKINTD